MHQVKKNNMKKLLILIIITLVTYSCATRTHCDAYDNVDYTASDSTKSV